MPRWFALALCVLGAIMVVAGLRQASRARQTRGWTRTTGRIIESRVQTSLMETEVERKERFAFAIRYAYDARGRTHESTQVWIGSSPAAETDDPETARGWVERFPLGAEVPVWFDPAEPSQAVLVPELGNRQGRVAAVFGAVMAAIGFFLLARGR
jgi:hypothetical protein